jgi:hypothetical protein
MAIVFLQQKNEQKKLILVFFFILLLTAVVLWFGYFKEDKLDEMGPVSVNPSAKKVDINFEVFKNPLFAEFRSFSPIEPFKESTSTAVGRENPFISY